MKATSRMVEVFDVGKLMRVSMVDTNTFSVFFSLFPRFIVYVEIGETWYLKIVFRCLLSGCRP